MTTSDKLKQQAYRRTYRGKITAMYDRIIFRGKINGKNNEYFTVQDFIRWLKENGYDARYKDWESSAYKKQLSPSVDRIDPLQGYTFKNMQLLTWEENRLKGNKEKLILWGKPIVQKDLSGNIINTFKSIKEAVEFTKTHQSAISRTINGGTKTANGFIWEYL